MTIVQKDRFIKNETPFGDLPEGWESTSLKTVATLKKGKKPYKVDKTTWPGAVPYIDIEAFEKGNIRRYADQESSFLVNEGDIIVVWDGARCGHVGKTPERGALGSTLGTIQPILIHPDYILRFLQLSYETINTNPRGIGIPHVEPELFWNLEIPLATLAEQKRIVAKVEELLTRVNATKERLAKVSMILKRFRQAVLAAACSGRLTADWHEANRVQDDFEESTIGEIAEYFGGFAYKSKIFLKQGQHQVIRIGNVRLMSLNLQSSPVFIPDHIAQQTERFRLHPDDIVISMTGTKYKKDYGFAAIVRESNGNLFLNQRVARLRCGDRALPKYLLYWLQTDTFHDFFFAGETGNVNQGNVGADGIRKAPIKLPSLCEQHEIVRRVESMFKLADAVEKRVAFATARAKKLTQAILAKAFRGELVPTEAELARCERRPYEPASELLARIKSERDAKQVSQKVHRNRN